MDEEELCPFCSAKTCCSCNGGVGCVGVGGTKFAMCPQIPCVALKKCLRVCVWGGWGEAGTGKGKGRIGKKWTGMKERGRR